MKLKTAALSLSSLALSGCLESPYTYKSYTFKPYSYSYSYSTPPAKRLTEKFRTEDGIYLFSDEKELKRVVTGYSPKSSAYSVNSVYTIDGRFVAQNDPHHPEDIFAKTTFSLKLFPETTLAYEATNLKKPIPSVFSLEESIKWLDKNPSPKTNVLENDLYKLSFLEKNKIALPPLRAIGQNIAIGATPQNIHVADFADQKNVYINAPWELLSIIAPNRTVNVEEVKTTLHLNNTLTQEMLAKGNHADIILYEKGALKIKPPKTKTETGETVYYGTWSKIPATNLLTDNFYLKDLSLRNDFRREFNRKYHTNYQRSSVENIFPYDFNLTSYFQPSANYTKKGASTTLDIPKGHKLFLAANARVDNIDLNIAGGLFVDLGAKTGHVSKNYWRMQLPNYNSQVLSVFCNGNLTLQPGSTTTFVIPSTYSATHKPFLLFGPFEPVEHFTTTKEKMLSHLKSGLPNDNDLKDKSLDEKINHYLSEWSETKLLVQEPSEAFKNCLKYNILRDLAKENVITEPKVLLSGDVYFITPKDRANRGHLNTVVELICAKDITGSFSNVRFNEEFKIGPHNANLVIEEEEAEYPVLAKIDDLDAFERTQAENEFNLLQTSLEKGVFFSKRIKVLKLKLEYSRPNTYQAPHERWTTHDQLFNNIGGRGTAFDLANPVHLMQQNVSHQMSATLSGPHDFNPAFRFKEAEKMDISGGSLQTHWGEKSNFGFVSASYSLKNNAQDRAGVADYTNNLSIYQTMLGKAYGPQTLQPFGAAVLTVLNMKGENQFTSNNTHILSSKWDNGLIHGGLVLGVQSYIQPTNHISLKTSLTGMKTIQAQKAKINLNFGQTGEDNIWPNYLLKADMEVAYEAENVQAKIGVSAQNTTNPLAIKFTGSILF